MNFKRAVITHGGAGSNSKFSDGTNAAANIALGLLRNNKSSLDSAIAAVIELEDDHRFNAGTGSQIRFDHKTIQMDAACMTSKGEFGAVACIENVKNPIHVAQKVLSSSNIILCGQGAFSFAKQEGCKLSGKNQATPSVSSCDTVGAVTYDGKNFSSALSSGGLKNSAIGRVGDVPLPGCGLYCGPLGGVACTGDGEFIALKFLAREVYTWLENGISPSNASLKALSLFEDSVDIGLIILTKNQFASASKNDMAWSCITEET